uniref:Uncharacterized protein n=1 Tax=Anguilla anguilla TaxID=7936 RepID=A0A0E9STB2_ANGAN
MIGVIDGSFEMGNLLVICIHQLLWCKATPPTTDCSRMSNHGSWSILYCSTSLLSGPVPVQNNCFTAPRHQFN